MPEQDVYLRDKPKLAREEFDKLETLGVICCSNSPWSSPLPMVPKGFDWRPCGDYHRLNNVTIPDKYPVSHNLDFAVDLAGMKFFSKIDLVKGYYQVPTNKKDIPKAAIITPFGLSEYLRIPFGLINAAQSFQYTSHAHSLPGTGFCLCLSG